MYSKVIKMGLENSAMEKYKGIKFEINNSETAQLAANMRKFGETLNSNVEINF